MYMNDSISVDYVGSARVAYRKAKHDSEMPPA